MVSSCDTTSRSARSGPAETCRQQRGNTLKAIQATRCFGRKLAVAERIAEKAAITRSHASSAAWSGTGHNNGRGLEPPSKRHVAGMVQPAGPRHRAGWRGRSNAALTISGYGYMPGGGPWLAASDVRRANVAGSAGTHRSGEPGGSARHLVHRNADALGSPRPSGRERRVSASPSRRAWQPRWAAFRSKKLSANEMKKRSSNPLLRHAHQSDYHCTAAPANDRPRGDRVVS